MELKTKIHTLDTIQSCDDFAEDNPYPALCDYCKRETSHRYFNGKKGGKKVRQHIFCGKCGYCARR